MPKRLDRGLLLPTVFGSDIVNPLFAHKVLARVVPYVQVPSSQKLLGAVILNEYRFLWIVRGSQQVVHKRG